MSFFFYLQLNIFIKNCIVFSLISSEWLSCDGALCSHEMTISDNTTIFVRSQCMCYQLLKARTSSWSGSARYVHRVTNGSHRKLQWGSCDLTASFAYREQTVSILCLWVSIRCHQLKLLTKFHEVFSINICTYSFQALKNTCQIYAIFTLKLSHFSPFVCNVFTYTYFVWFSE
jgi:hypothetical protein